MSKLKKKFFWYAFWKFQFEKDLACKTVESALFNTFSSLVIKLVFEIYEYHNSVSTVNIKLFQ